MYHPRRQNYLFGTCENTTSSEMPMQEYYFLKHNLTITFTCIIAIGKT